MEDKLEGSFQMAAFWCWRGVMIKTEDLIKQVSARSWWAFHVPWARKLHAHYSEVHKVSNGSELCHLCLEYGKLHLMWSTALEACNVMETISEETARAFWGGVHRLSMEWPRYSVFSVGTPFQALAPFQFHGKGVSCSVCHSTHIPD